MLKTFLTLIALVFAVACFAAVDVNQATEAELDSIKGIGPATSTRILDERKKSSFKDWGDFISRVKGIGASTATRFSAQGLTVNGAAFKGATTAPATKPAASAASK